MNLKKLLCSLLAIAMILSTMGVSVLADETPVAQIGADTYLTLAEALDAAEDGETIELIADPDVAINANGKVVGNKTVTITGSAKFNWEAGFLFVGRGGEGDGKLIFENATITTDNTRGNASCGLYAATTSFEDGADVADKNFGVIEIIDSDIQLSYLRNQNEVIVDNSKLTVYGGFSIAGRDGYETESGEDSTATMTIKNNSEVVVKNTNGMGIGYTDDNSSDKEGSGILNLENSSFICEAGTLVGPEGEFNISGDVTVNIPAGTVNAVDDVTFKGENSVGLLPIEQYTFTIEEGASLEMTSTARPVIGHGATLNIEGDIVDAKTADVSALVPSLIIKGGASFTGNSATVNVNNAYIDTSVSGYSSTSKSASGTFEFNVTNSIWTQTAGKIQFQIGAEPTVKLNLTDSKLDLSNYLTVQPKASTVIIDNSTVKATQFENRGDFRILNGSEVTMSSVAESSNGNQPGKITVDNAKFTVGSGQFLGRYMVTANPREYSDMTGELILKNGAEVSLGGHIKDVFVTVDTSSTLTTSKIDGEAIVTIDASNITVGKNKVLDLSETESREGKVTISPELIASGQDVIYGDDGDVTVDMYVAKVDGETYPTLQSALNAIKDTDGKTIYLYGTIEEGHVKLPTPFKNLTIDGNPTGARTTGAVVKNTQITDTQGNNFVYDGLTVKNITFDNSNFLLAGRNAGNVYGDLVFDNNRFINFYNTSSLAPVHMNLGADSTFKSFTFKNNLVENVSGSSNNAIAIKQVEGKTIIENNTFKNIPNNAVQVFYSNGIELTKNTISETGGALVNLNGTTGDISFTENTMSKNRAGQKFVTYLADGKGVSLSDNKWYDENGNQLSSFGDFEAMYDGLYYLDFDHVLEIADAGDTIYLPEGKYLVPAAAGENQATIVFDFNGGQNADGFVSETFNLNLGQAINAPAGIVKDGFIFRGWDKEVPAVAYATETYTAVWVSEDDYGFETVLTPVGGTKLSDREIKIDPNGSFLIEVSVEDLYGDSSWNVAEITLDYDNTLFKWNTIGTSVEAVDADTLRFKIYGADQVDGKAVKQISFTALNPAAPQTYTGEFTVVEATVDTDWAANTIDATPAVNGSAKVYIYYSYDVSLGEGLQGPATATTDADYVGKIVDYDDDYEYVIDGKSGNNDLNITYDDEGNFKVTKDQIVGDMTIEVERTGVKGITTDDVEIYEYIAGKYALVLLNANASRVYTYNGALMYETPWYDTVAGEKKHFAYLVKETGFTVDAAGSLNTAENKALALANIGVTKAGDTRTNIVITNNTGDVNNTGVLDVNDIQAVWNCYNVIGGNGAAGVNVNMPLYLRADICGANKSNRDKKVDVSDLNAVLAMYDCQNSGGTVTITDAVLASCGVDGSTYSIKCGETVIVESVTGISVKNDPTAAGHNYSAAFEGEGANTVYVLTCSGCGGRIETEISDIFSTLNVNGQALWGVADVDTAEELMIFNKLEKEGKLSHGEGRSVVLNINNNIDLAGYEWTSMSGHFFTINGNGNTISNINAKQGVSGKGGFISYAGGCKINDLTLKNVTVEGCQVGAFVGAGEGATVKNCVLKGDVNITWKQNYTSTYVEEYGSIGIIAGNHYGSGTYEVVIDKNADITVDSSAFAGTKLEEAGYVYKNEYVQYVYGSPVISITDNRN